MSSTSTDYAKVREYFERWYIEPLRVLASIPNGDGAFIALSTACFLYERYADALAKKAGKRPTPESRIEQLMADFGIDQETAEVFWKIMRDGILHKAMPKKKDRSKDLPGWRFQHEFDQPIRLDRVASRSNELQVHPWLFVKKVLDLWRENLKLIDRNDSFPWAKIVLVPENSSQDTANVPGTVSEGNRDQSRSVVTGSSSSLNELL